MDYFDHPYLKVFVLKFFTFYGVTYHMMQDEEGSTWMFDRAGEWRKRMRTDQAASSSSKLDPLQQSMTMACFHSQRYLIEVLGQRGKVKEAKEVLKSQAELLKDVDPATLENYPVIKCYHAEQVAAINNLSSNKGQMRKMSANLGVPIAGPDLNSSSYR